MTVKCVYRCGSIVPQELEKLREYKRSLREGAVLAMTFEPWDDRRTRSQQGLLHEMLGRLARAQGMSLEQCKMQHKLGLGYYIEADKVAEIRPKYRGAFIDEADVYEGYPSRLLFVRSEADYTRKMEGELIDAVIEACNANGVDIGDILEQLNDRA